MTEGIERSAATHATVEQAAAGSPLLESAREMLRQLARELAWLPERAAVIRLELTAAEARLAQGGEGTPTDLEAQRAMRKALSRVIRSHVEPAIADLQAAAGHGETAAGHGETAAGHGETAAGHGEER